MKFYSLYPIGVIESAYYRAHMWIKPELNKKLEHNKMDITRIGLAPARHIIRLDSENYQRSIYLYCMPDNYDAIKIFLFKTFPNAKDDGAAYY